MLHGLSLVVFCGLLVSAQSQERIFFAVVPWPGAANPFLDYVEGSVFKRAVPNWQDSANVWSTRLQEHVRRYPVHRALAGLSIGGHDVSVTIDSVSEPVGDLYQTLFTVEVKPAVDAPVLFWTGPRDGIQFVSPTSGAVSPDFWRVIQGHADSMFSAALPHYMHEGAKGRLRLQQPEISVVGSKPKRMTVFVPATIEWEGGGTDDRASLFFLVALPSDSILFERFGHPEWSPMSGDKVLIVRPRLFFRLRAFGEMYFFGNWELAWEHFGFGIFKLADGELVARSF
jgi:hypothetical protein